MYSNDLQNIKHAGGGGVTFLVGYHPCNLVKVLSRHTEHMFSRHEKDPKYAYLYTLAPK